jgi:hypothetical protein
MKLKYLFAATLFFSLTAPAIAADAQKDKASDSDQPAQKEKKICRTQMVTGSLIQKRRTCKTEAEWRESDAKTQQGIDAYSKEAGKPQQSSSPLG